MTDPPLRVCATVMASTTGDLVRARDAAAPHADLVELRIDRVADPDMSRLLAGRSRPVVVTCRPEWEGGAFAGSEEQRHRLLWTALEAGAEFVDVEWAASFRDDLLRRAPDRIVLSMHDFTGVPRDLPSRYRAMRASGAVVVKLAVAVDRLEHQLALVDLARSAREAGRHVLIAMGEAGVASRVLGARLGNAWTYAGDGVAPGQMPVEELVSDYGVSRLRASADIYGLLGRPVGHSLSPAMHNAAFRALGIPAVYLPLAAADLADFVAFAEAMGVRGVSVTAPFKREALELARAADPICRTVGAANTLRRTSDGAWEATNTDVDGFLAPLREVDLPGMRAAVLGTGGAARAVVVALRARAARVRVYGRRPLAAAALASELGVEAGGAEPTVGDWDLLINATPVGTWPDTDACPLAEGLVRGDVVYDLVYNPRRTRLLRVAARAGARTIGGLDMLVAQAERQFAWWTGQAPPAGIMHDAAERALDRRAHGGDSGK